MLYRLTIFYFRYYPGFISDISETVIVIGMYSKEYMLLNKEYKNNIHITPKYIDNFLIENEINENKYANHCMLKKYCGYKATISDNICDTGRFFVCTGMMEQLMVELDGQHLITNKNVYIR